MESGMPFPSLHLDVVGTNSNCQPTSNMDSIESNDHRSFHEMYDNDDDDFYISP